jgi:hypothetical protein
LTFVPPSSVCKGNDLLKNPFFVDPSKDFNSGILTMKKFDLAPENWSWGLRGYSWDTNTLEQYPITECNFSSYRSRANDSDVWLYGKDDSGRLGVVTLIQGWVWQDSSPPNGWYIFPLLPVSGTTNMTIRAWIKHRGGLYPPEKMESLRNGIIDIWMRDEITGKNLMMDLYFFGDGLSWKDQDTYHYASKVDDVPEETWSDVVVDVDHHIDLAIKEAAKEGMIFDKRGLKIYQVEILEETKYAWGELQIGSFEFTYCRSVSFLEGLLPRISALTISMVLAQTHEWRYLLASLLTVSLKDILVVGRDLATVL